MGTEAGRSGAGRLAKASSWAWGKGRPRRMLAPRSPSTVIEAPTHSFNLPSSQPHSNVPPPPPLILLFLDLPLVLQSYLFTSFIHLHGENEYLLCLASPSSQQRETDCLAASFAWPFGKQLKNGQQGD